MSNQFVDSIMEAVVCRNPGEAEFHQAVQEVAQVQPEVQQAPEPVPVQPKMSPPQKKPKKFGKKLSADDFTDYTSLFTIEEGRRGVVVTFLAILELMKEQLIELVQSEAFASIHVKAVSSSEK